MEEFVLLARSLVTIGLAAMLVMLRLDSERFGTAEYYEATRDGERPRIRRRLAWYAMGAGLVILILYVAPAPQTDLFLGSGDRVGAIVGGFAYAALGVTQALVFAWIRYHRVR